jgi:FtsP/CotA-like multicopper oxidase with cupredoxin domain
MTTSRMAARAARISNGRLLGTAGLAVALMCAPHVAWADAITEPAVFASFAGVLDILMVAKPKPVPTISFQPPGGGAPINPVGWVYEICPRPAASNQCPAGATTVSDYGGVRLALQAGDVLKVRLVNRLPLLDPAKLKHVSEPGQANLFRNPTNLHTHGLIVPARPATLSDPTFGDYVFVDIYNPANGTPVPQATHQHGSVKMDFADYRIDIPANHPSGAFWFHPHVHGIALNQVSSGLAGIISIGSVNDYVLSSLGNIRHLILKDMQVLAAGTYQYDSGPVTAVDGEVQHQQIADFCEQFDKGGPNSRQGFCEGGPDEHSTGNTFIGSRWYFTVNGQVFPTVRITSPLGEIWRLTSASGQFSYRLNLVGDSTGQPMLMQLISIDGVSIHVPPGTPAGTIMSMGGGKFTVVDCPSGSTTLLPVCVRDLVMMPSSRAEVWVTYRNSNGTVVAPPPGATATLQQAIINLGPAGEEWPQVKLLKVEFAQSSPTSTAMEVAGHARAALSPGGIFAATASPAARAPAARAPTATSCRPLANGHRRRIFFGVENPTDPDTPFGLGYEEIDQNGVVVPGTQVPVSAFNPANTLVCLPLGPGGSPVHEIWELVNLATEIHNFHIHQTKFRVLDATALVQTPQSIFGTAVILEDNVPIPFGVANISDVEDNQNGYCTIEQWRSGQCTSRPIVLDIPFSQLGEFVYHCHILEHEDGGMMAKIVVVPEPLAPTATTHDFNADFNSDILWREAGGGVALWLMAGAQVLQSGSLGSVSTSWTIVGQRDFNADGNYDILWRDTGGNVAIWLMSGLQILQSGSLGAVPASWTVAGTGDFNGDSNGDILWRDSGGNVAIWLMNGLQITQSGSLGLVPTSWTIAGTGDFNGDGNWDILWRDAGGTVAIWLLNGLQVLQSGSLGAVGANWTIAGTGDFNGDGKSDILWRDGNSGAVTIWFMNGLQVTQTGAVGVVPASWQIAETGDFNADGRSDILWRQTGGAVALWLMNGSQITQSLSLGQVGTSWQIQSTNAD